MPPKRITRRQLLQGGASLAGGAALGALSSCALPSLLSKGGPPVARRVLGRTGLSVSALSFGGALIMGYHTLEGDAKAARRRLILEALDHGINFFDTYKDDHLPVYACLPRDPGKALVLFKTDTMSRDGTRKEVEGALKATKRERLDLVAPHGYPWGDPGNALSEIKDPEKWKVVLEAMDEMVRLKQQGKVGFVGYVSHSAPHLKRVMLQHADLVDFIMVRYGPFTHLDPCAEAIDLARERNLGVIAFKTLDGSTDYAKRLETWRGEEKTWSRIQPHIDAGLTPAQACIRYASSKPGVHTALVGMRTRDEIREDLKAV